MFFSSLFSEKVDLFSYLILFVACAFESRWKQLSRKLPRKGKGNEVPKLEETKSVLLLKHRYTALDQVKNSIDCSHLKIDWHSNLY